MPGGDSSICFTWGHYFAGREKEGMECFRAAIKYFQDRVDNKKIYRFMVGVAAQGNFTNFAGYLVAEGPASEIDAIFDDDAEPPAPPGPPSPPMPQSFQGLVSLARHCIFNFSVVRCDALGAIDPDPTPPPGKTKSRRREKFEATGKKLHYWP